MARKARSTGYDLERHHREIVLPCARTFPWVLRVTEHKDKPAPVFIVKERQGRDAPPGERKVSVLVERASLYGDPLRRVTPVLRSIVERVRNDDGIPLELHRRLDGASVSFRGNLPLDDEAGCKLALIFSLAQRVKQMDRVELMARRIERFTREEAAYWHSRVADFGPVESRWARTGFRVLLAGESGDPDILPVLEKLRRS